MQKFEFLTQAPEGCIVKVHVVPGASRTKLVGPYDGRLKVSLAAAPVEGAANQMLIELFAATFKLSRSKISLKNGHISRKKDLFLQGSQVSDIALKIEEILKPRGR